MVEEVAVLIQFNLNCQTKEYTCFRKTPLADFNVFYWKQIYTLLQMFCSVYYEAWFRSSHHRYSIKKGVLRIASKLTIKHLYQSLFFNKAPGHEPATLLKDTLGQVFSCEFCETSENAFFTEQLWTTTSIDSKVQRINLFVTQNVILITCVFHAQFLLFI